MKVSLINYTPQALETLLFTKSTRLRMTARGIGEIASWPEERKMDEWRYMQGTIKSSWEFVDYIFLIEGVSRAFTHQLVRHRVGTSFAQQAQRVVDMSGFEYVVTGNIQDVPERLSEYMATMEDIDTGYQELIKLGTNPQDARGVLPTNICTNIVFKANLRTLNTMCAERLCVKAQGEFQEVMRAIRKKVIEVHPWAEPALRVYCAQHGVCAFPDFSRCPFKGGVYNPRTGLRYDEDQELIHDNVRVDRKPMTLDEIQAEWEVNRAEAQPTGEKDGDSTETK